MAQRKKTERRRRTGPPRPRPVLQRGLAVTEIGARGDGLALLGGQPVYIPYTAPGDRVDALVSGGRGVVETLQTPSPVRAEPVCRHFGACGGCALQHVDGEFYQAWKRELVAIALAREGFDPAIASPLERCPVASRRRASFAVAREKGALRFGFHRRQAHAVIDIEECPILAPAFERRLPALRQFCEALPGERYSLAATLCQNGLDIDVSHDGEREPDPATLAALPALMEAAGVIRLTWNGEPVLMLAAPIVSFDGVAATPSPGGFLQASEEGQAVLINWAQEALIGAGRVVDLFCGVGAFALPLGRDRPVDGFDGDGPAIEALNNAARGGDLKYPVRGAVRNLFQAPLMAAELKAYDAAILDPPRAGARTQAEALAASSIARVVSVSCNPNTFARDARILCDGGFSLSRVRPLDQFVFGPHVELMGIFQRS